MNSAVEHEPERRRFVLRIEGAVAALDYVPRGERTLDYRHTFVPEPLRGRGIASKLTAAALEYAQANDLGVVPTCPFVAAFIDRHPKYRPLIRP